MAKDGTERTLKDSAKTYGVKGLKFIGRNGGKLGLTLMGGTGKLGLKTIDAIGKHDGAQTVMAIAGVGIATMAVSPLVLAGVGGTVALKFASDKLSNNPIRKSKDLVSEFIDIARFGGNVVGKVHEHILSPVLSKGTDLINEGQKKGKNFLDNKLGKDDEERGDE